MVERFLDAVFGVFRRSIEIGAQHAGVDDFFIPRQNGPDQGLNMIGVEKVIIIQKIQIHPPGRPQTAVCRRRPPLALLVDNIGYRDPSCQGGYHIFNIPAPVIHHHDL